MKVKTINEDFIDIMNDKTNEFSELCVVNDKVIGVTDVHHIYGIFEAGYEKELEKECKYLCSFSFDLLKKIVDYIERNEQFNMNNWRLNVYYYKKKSKVLEAPCIISNKGLNKIFVLAPMINKIKNKIK